MIFIAMSWFKFGSKKPEYYKGILIHADTGLHGQVMTTLRSYQKPSAFVLDLGAGEGAFSQRLADVGYKVVAVDLSKSDFKPRSLPFIPADLEKPEARQMLLEKYEGKVDVVVCMEVIEHVKDQWGLIEFAAKLLKHDGILLLTTPNITSHFSRVTFLFMGHPHQFDVDAESYGHISPISSRALERMLEASHFSMLEKRPGGFLPFIWIHRSVALMVFHFISFALYPLMRGDKRGWCLIYVARKCI